MAADSTHKIMAALEAIRPGCARFVGGCVRDALMNRPVADIDIATQILPDTVAERMREAGFAVHPTGIEHGTLTVVVDHRPFEVTTLRRDVETDGRRATVAFTEDWAEDAQRRDFRMNALFASADGEVFDPTGGGLSDIAAGRVVFVGDPDIRIREDYLRILRFFRFSAWFAAPPLDAEGLAACARRADGLGGLSAERVWAETRKLLAAPDPRSAVFAMDSTGVLGRLYPWAGSIGNLSSLIAQDLSAGEAPDPLLRVLAMCAANASSVDVAVRTLKMSNAEAARLRRAARSRSTIEVTMTEDDLRLALYRNGPETTSDLIRLAWARDPGAGDWASLLARARAASPPVFPVAGADLVAMGIPSGPEIGRRLADLEEAWIQSGFRESRTVLLARLGGG